MSNREVTLNENECFLAALYLDPRVNSILSYEQCSRARAVLAETYKRIILLKRTTQQETTEPEAGYSRRLDLISEEHINFDNYLRQTFARNRTTRSEEHSIERELNFKLVAFLEEPIQPSLCNILDFWEKRKLTDPYLYNLSKVVLATPPTSVSVERLFSSLKFVLNNLRMSLNDSIIEDVMVIRNNHLYSTK